jgi:hypothetical protein
VSKSLYYSSDVECKNIITSTSSVGIETGYGLDHQGLGIQFLAGAGSFSLLHSAQTSSGAYPASYPMGTGTSFPRGKVSRARSWPPHPSAKVKNAWCCTSIPKYVFMAWCLVKHRDNFTFTLPYWWHRKATLPYVFMTWCLIKYRIHPLGLDIWLSTGITLPYLLPHALRKYL